MHDATVALAVALKSNVRRRQIRRVPQNATKVVLREYPNYSMVPGRDHPPSKRDLYYAYNLEEAKLKFARVKVVQNAQNGASVYRRITFPN